MFDHLSYFKPKDFETLMKGYGFIVKKKRFASYEQNPFGMIQSLLNMVYSKRELLYEHLKGNKEYTEGYSRFNLMMQKAFLVFSYPIFVFTDILESALHKGASVEYHFIKEKV